MTRFLTCTSCLMCLFVFGGVGIVGARGQASADSGRLEGRVLDPSGALLPGATITVNNIATGASGNEQTDSKGHFEFLALAPGHYRVSFTSQGFGTTSLNDVIIRVGTTTSLEPHLQVGAAETQIAVTSETLIDTQQSSLSTVVNRQSIDSLPLNGRNFTDFTLLTPGATTDGQGMVSFNGVAGNFNNYSVDGGNNNNAFFSQQIGRTTVPFQFSEDVIQEFQVTNSGFEAEFGQAGGGLVNTVTRSGANQIHGDAYYFILDSAFNANDPINKRIGIAKPPNQRQQFGGTLGGPIKHNRIFYLANYEGQLRNEPITVNNSAATVGLPADFLTTNPTLAAQVNAASGSFARSFNQNAAFAKVNVTLNSKNSLDATYNYQRYRSPHGYFNAPTSSGDGLSLTDGSTSHFFQASLRTIFNSKTMNDLRFHSGSDLHFDLPDTPPRGPAIIIQNPDSGFVFGGNRFELSTSDHRFEYADNFTKLVGKHTLKLGIDVNDNHDSDYFVYGPAGAYFFATLPDVVAGNFQLYLQSFGQSTVPIHSPTYSLYGQDEFRVTSQFNLNYGLRYDLQVLPQPPACNPDLTLTCHIHYSKDNVAPRVGFTFSPSKNRSTVVRGSFGLFYEQEDLLDVSQVTSSNGISRPFLAATGPAYGNGSPLVTYPQTLQTFPSGARGTPSAVVFAPNFRSPYVEQGNFGIDQQISAHSALSVSYVYTHGLALLGNSNGVTRQANGNFGRDLNLVPPAMQVQYGGNFTQDTLFLPNGGSYVVPDYEAIDGILNPNFGAINVVDNTGSSKYNALQVSFRQNSPQFFAQVSYTLAKATDRGTGYYNQFDISAQRGRSALDQRHRLAASGGWTPTHGLMRSFIVSGVLTEAAGRPYTGVLDVAQVNFSLVPGQGYNSFTGPDTNDFDLSLARDIHFKERYILRLRAEAFDLFNHANYLDTVNNVQYVTTQRNDMSGNSTNVWDTTPNPGFGTPLATFPEYGARNFQFSSRFSF